ncbi:MAG: hypothetical protein ABFC71_07930 [Methanoregula sp.]
MDFMGKLFYFPYNRGKLVVGEERVIRPLDTQTPVLGIPVFDTGFQITLYYPGTNGKNPDFDTTVTTSKQVPGIVLWPHIPSNMNA